MANEINVEVVFADREQQYAVDLTVPAGISVQQVIEYSGLLHTCQIDLETMAVGIFAKKVGLTTTVAAGDRVEIYRPLLIDPKQARLRRVQVKSKPSLV